MGWWSKAVSAVKSAVNKAVSAVKSVVSSVSRAVSNTVSKVSSAVKSVASSVSRAVSNTVSKASLAVSNVANTIKNTVSNVVEKTKDNVAAIAETVKIIVAIPISKVREHVGAVENAIIEKLWKGANEVRDKIDVVVDNVKKTISHLIVKAKGGTLSIARAVGESVDDFVKRASSAVDRVVNIVKTKVSDAVEKTKEKIEDVKETVKEIIVKKIEEPKKIIDVITKRESLLNKILKALIPTPFAALTQTPPLIKEGYKLITGKELTDIEWVDFQLKFADWILSIEVFLKLFTGKNLKGEPEEFGTFLDYTELVFALAIIIPAGKIPAVASKLGIKAGTTLGLKGFTQFALTKIDDAAKLFKILNVDDQAKLIGKLSKTDEGVKVINALISKLALHKTLVKPTISIVNKKIAESILRRAGLLGFLPKMLRPKTIIGGILGMASILGLAYGIPFGTSWLAKEGIKEQFEIPLADRMRDYRYEPTVEKLEIIKDDIKKLRAALPIARTTIMRIAWLWPPTKEAWEFYAENIYFSIEQYEKELELLLPPELIKIPETVKAIVRDIIDGDTIDTGLDAKDAVTGREIKLPEYAKTGHARIRIVGINAPEKSPKGEILCSDVEIFNVEKKFTDESRDRLLPLNDKEVILKIDPEISVDTYNRILAVVEFQGEDIGLRQIEEGLACGYYRDPHKYYNEAEYSAATLAAKSDGIGMWAGLEEVEKEEEKIKIIITSEPKNAKLYLDDVALRHNTPSDEVELSDVMHLFTLGKHVLSAEKAGLSAMEDIEIVKGDNGTIHLTLETAPFPEVPTPEEVEEEEIKEELIEKEIEEEKIEEVVVEEIEEPVTIKEAFEDLVKRGLELAVEIYTPVKPAEIPKEYTNEQSWVLNEAFAKVLELTEGRDVMSNKEKVEFIESFSMHTDGQKEVLNLLFKDVLILTRGRNQLSADEYIELKEKYGMT